MKKLLFIIASGAASAALVFALSCNKATVDTNTTTASDYSMVQNEFFHLLPMFNSIVSLHPSKGIYQRVSAVHYPVITEDSTHGLPYTIKVNYGPGVTDSLDHKFRAGEVIASFNGHWNNITTVMTISFSGYSVNNNLYSGSLTFKHSANNPNQYVVSISGICTVTGYPPLNYNASGLLFTQINGIYPPDTVAWHGVYTISGSGSGQDRNQTKYDFTTTITLVKYSNCANIASGEVTLTPAGLATRTVIYSGGSNCNTSASVTIDGQNYNITSD